MCLWKYNSQFKDEDCQFKDEDETLYYTPYTWLPKAFSKSTLYTDIQSFTS